VPIAEDNGEIEIPGTTQRLQETRGRHYRPLLRVQKAKAGKLLLYYTI
jgi:hypothetical protein